MEVVDVADPSPGPDDVVVQVAACGVCGTDVHILHGEFAPRLPVTPGHELAGTVVAVGRDVAGLRVGDVVAADPNLYCGRCHYCRRGRGNLCERFAAVGVTHPGAAAEYVAVPASNCVRLPGHVRAEDAVDCTGAPSAIEDGLARVGRGGTFLQVGVTSPGTHLAWEPYRVFREEITITGSMGVLHSYERAAEMLLGGLVDPALLVSDRFGLDDYRTALDLVAAGTARKVLVHPHH